VDYNWSSGFAGIFYSVFSSTLAVGRDKSVENIGVIYDPAVAFIVGFREGIMR